MSKALNPYPRAWRDGKAVRVHRLLAQQLLERELEPGEVVHHRNGNMVIRQTSRRITFGCCLRNGITWCSSIWNAGGLEGLKRCLGMKKFSKVLIDRTV